MSVRTDKINLIVDVNGDEARNSLNKLKKTAQDIKNEMQGLKKGSQEFIDKSKQLKEVEAAMAAVKKQIGLTALTQKELVAELNKLKALKGSVEPFSKEFKELDAQIKKVDSRLYDVKNGVQGFASFFSKIKDEVKQFGLMAAAYLGFEFLSNQLTNIISGAGKLSDQLADIRRVTGMTNEEVNKLNESLGRLDTRTSTSALREIAVVAGKLGVAKNDILEFVKATDMLVVALGDELGDADQITTQLGKIIGVFDKGDKKVTGEKLTLIGNAIVDLANKGVASGGFIVDFTQRLAGLADTADLALPAVMGLAAGLEESGQRSESSSTAIIKVLGQIGTDVPKFAKIAGKSVEEFSKTLREKPVEAIIQVSEGLTKGKKGFEDISKAFADAGEDGAKIISTLGVIGGRADFFREKITDAGSAMQNANQINEAFALKNETLGGSLDKLGKEFNKLMTSNTVTNFLKGAVEGARDFIKWLKEIPDWVSRNTIALQLLAMGVLLVNRQYVISAYVTARDTIVKGYNAIATRATALATTLATTAQAAYIVITNLLTGSITLATAAQRLWSIAMSVGLGPIGIMIALVGALVIAFNQQSAAAKMAADIQKKVAESTTEEISKIKTLAEVVKDTNVSLDNRKKALAALIAINPQYLSGLTLENIATAEGKKLLDGYISSLLKKAEVEAKNATLIEKLKERNIEFAKLRSADPKLAQTSDDQLTARVAEVGQGSMTNPKAQILAAGYEGDVELLKLQETIKQIASLQSDVTAIAKKNVTDLVSSNKTIGDNATETVGIIEKLQSKIKALQEALPKLTSQKAINTNLSETKKLQEELDAIMGKKSSGEKKGESELERLKKEAAKFAEDLKKLRATVEISGMDADQQEIARAEEKYKELTAKALNYYKKHATTKVVYDGQLIELEKLFQMEVARIQKKRFAEDAAKEYDHSLKLSAEYFDKLQNQAGLDYAAGKLSKKQYEEELKKIERQEANNRVIIAQDYVGTVKKATEDLVGFKKTQEEKTTADLIAEHEKRVEFEKNEKLADANNAVLTAPDGSQRQIQAKKNQLQVQFDIETEGMDKTTAMYEEKWNTLYNNLAELDKQSWNKKIEEVEKYLGYFTQALTSINTLLNNSENRQLAKDKSANEQKKAGYKKQLDNKLMSKAQFDQKMQAADEEYDKKEKAIKRRQAERDKALAIFSAIINTAAAVAKALPNIPLSIIAGILGGIQVAAIASNPLPELGKGKWIRDGDKHSDASGGIHAKIERDEAVMSAAAMTDANQYTVTGTTAQITSALNAKNNGTAWASGAVVQMTPWLKNRPASINPNMPRIMEQGGVVRPMNQQQAQASSNDAAIVQLTNEFKAYQERMENWQSQLHIVYSPTDTKKMAEIDIMYEASKKASGIN